MPTSPSLPPEERVLRLAARRRLPADRRERLGRMLGAPLAWDRLLRRAGHLGVLPLLSHHVHADAGLARAMPGRWRPALEEARLQTIGRNLVLFRALEEALEALAREGAAVIPLKGAHLIPEVYRGFDLRTASDLDLLVRREDLRAVDAALRGAGYVSHRPVERHAGPDADPGVTSAFYRRPGEDRYFVDLHWDLVEIPPVREAGIFPVDLAEVWARSRPWSYEGRPARALDPVDHLLFVMLHALKHAFHPLIFLVDIAEMTDGLREDERREVGARAARWGLGRDLGLVAGLLRDVLGVAWPIAGASARGTASPTPGERLVRRQVLRGRDAPGAAFAIYVERLDGWRARLRFLRRTFLPPPAEIPWVDGAEIDTLGAGERLRRAGRGLRMSLDLLGGGRRTMATPP